MRATRALFVLPLLMSSAAHAAMPTLQVEVDGVKNGQPIPAKQAVCLPTADGKSSAEGKNMLPTISWSGAPEGTDSFAIFIMDPDVPADFTDAGKEGKVIAKDAKRQDFYHYGVVRLPASAKQYPPRQADASHGTLLVNDMGLNKYVPTPTAYGGPCPPWNDERVHNYHYIVLALDKDAPVLVEAKMPVGSQPADEPMTAKQTFARLIQSKHVLAQGVVIGTYTLNQTLLEKPQKR